MGGSSDGLSSVCTRGLGVELKIFDEPSPSSTSKIPSVKSGHKQQKSCYPSLVKQPERQKNIFFYKII
jgi:hypothetical protein